MFNFTTETILNDLTKVKYLLGGLTAPASGVDWDPGIEAAEGALYIERLNKFLVSGTSDFIKDQKVYKRAATAAVQAVRQITIPTVVVGTLYRIGVQITTNGYADGQFARDRVTYGKPFYVEILATATTDTVAATAFKNAWNKAFEAYDNFPIATTSGAALIFTSDNNPFIQFNSIILESIDTTTGNSTPVTATVSAGTAGVPGFGSYTDLLRSHRLPTLDNFRPFGENQEELPVMGATYNQYTFEYVADRGTMGNSVVGGQAISKTTHVLWVNNAAASVVRHITGASGVTGTYSFETLLRAVGLTIIDAASKADVTPVAVTEA